VAGAWCRRRVPARHGAALGMHPDMLGKGVESIVHAVNWWIVVPGFL
jgi:hypothetical protein